MVTYSIEYTDTCTSITPGCRQCSIAAPQPSTEPSLTITTLTLLEVNLLLPMAGILGGHLQQALDVHQ